MLKAFLCHSSEDKSYVDIVARRLKRGRVQYDSMCFEAGVDFRESIRKSLIASSLFVFFASRRSVQSLWVKFEIREAEDLLQQEVLRSGLALIIDDETRVSELPDWMRRALVESVRQPSRATRIIELHLNRLRGLEAEPIFIGRETLLADFSEKLIPAPEMVPPHLIVVGGLSGVGRRSFLRRALKDTLSVDMGPKFILEATDGVDTLHSLLLDELGELDKKSQLAAAMKGFRNSPLAEKGKEIARLLAGVAVGNAAPVVLDDGALLDADTKFTPEAHAIFEGLKSYRDTVVAFVHTRRPNLRDEEWKLINAAYIRVPPLDLPSTTLLLNQSLRRASIAATSEQIDELALYMDGYPPAVALAVSLAKEYGLATVLADKSMLGDFKIRTFVRILQKLPLEEEDWEILRILASEPVLPLGALSSVRGLSQEDIAGRLRRLIDFNLLLPVADVFQISPPIRGAVFALRGPLSDAEFATIAERLRAEFWTDPERLPRAEVVNATVHAVSRSNVAALRDFGDIVLPSVLYKAAKENYDRGGQEAWEAGRELAKRVLDLVPDHKPARIILLKILVRLNDWTRAKKVLTQIKASGYVEQHYLGGFLLWKQGELARAVSAFQSAIAVGHRSPEVYHGLGHCLFRLGNESEAQKVVREGLEGRRPNKLLLDLAAQITITLGYYEEAEDYIDQLKRLGEDVDYHHRMSTLLNARKNFGAALTHAKQASAAPRRRFEVLANEVDILIELEDFEGATNELAELDRHFRVGWDKHDVRIGLRCKLLLRRKQWRQAEALWNELKVKNTRVHLALLAEILRRKINDVTTSPGEQIDAQQRLETITVPGPEGIALFAETDEVDGGDLE